MVILLFGEESKETPFTVEMSEMSILFTLFCYGIVIE